MKLTKDQISSIFWLLFSVVMLVSSNMIPLGTFRNPGGGFVPFLAAFVLAIISLINLIITSLEKSGRNEKPIFLHAEINWRNIFKALGALLAFPLLLETLGFNLTVFGFMLFLSKAIEPRKWTVAILFAFITAFVCYLLFVRWLKYSVEIGIFGI
jgi:putative tricarboxylic transport membrane protein